MNDANQLYEFLMAHKYWAFASLAVGLMVRLLKAHPVLAEKLPPRARPWIAVGLGVASGVLESIVSGTPVVKALMLGAISGFGAIIGHDLFIEGLRNGKEIGAPAAARAAVTSVTPMLLIVGMVFGINTTLNACLPLGKGANSALSALQMGCVIYMADSDKPESTIANACQIADALIPEIKKLLSAQKAAAGMRKTGMAVTESADGGIVVVDAGR